MLRVLSILPILVVMTCVTALQHYDNFREGSCTPVRPIKASRIFVDSLKYLSAGSKYHMFRTASSLPNFRTMLEDEYYYKACFVRNTTTSMGDSIAAVFGFGGQLLNAVRFTTRPGVYLEGVSTNPSQPDVGLTDIITHTDNKSFAIIVACHSDSGGAYRAWVAATLTPTIDSRTRRMIENLAVSLGFKKENFVFLRYDSCNRGNPLLGINKNVGRKGQVPAVSSAWSSFGGH